MCKRGRVWKIGAVIALLTVAWPCRADAPTREYQVKAAFVYNFTQFVEWPDSAFASKDSPFVVATVGADPFNGALEQAMAAKSVADRSVTVEHFASVDSVGPCQLLFVPASQDSSAKALCDKLDGKPVLTIGESDEFLPAGGGVRFFFEDNRIRFEINLDPIAADGLKVSAKLMKLARIYRK